MNQAPKASATARPAARVETAPGRGGIAVIALSGPGADAVLQRVFRPWRAHAGGDEGVLQLGHVVAGDEIIDEAVVGRRGGRIEINIHGGPQAARATLRTLAQAGADVRPAAPAEPDSFWVAHPRWNNPGLGREMLAAIAVARSGRVVAAVATQWSGGVSELARRALDAIEREAAGGGPAPLAVDLRRAADGLATMRKLLEPPEVVLAGPPNVGKSTLANALTGRQVSIVHDVPGTTRDWVRELALLDGVPVWLTDTAGIWADAVGIDAEAVRRARRRVDRADLVVLIETGEAFDAPAWLGAGDVLRVAGKYDLPAGRQAWPGPARPADVCVSARTGEGMDALCEAILSALGLAGLDTTAAMAFTDRQADLLGAAAEALDRDDRPAAAAALRDLLEGVRA